MSTQEEYRKKHKTPEVLDAIQRARHDHQKQPHIRGRFAPVPLEERFLDRVLIMPDGCWEWTGSLNWFGHGVISPPGKRTKLQAHRLAYELLVGPIPEGLELDHLCRNPSCVNTAHLEPVTHAENVRRGMRGRLVTHCPQGHEYTEDNIYYYPPGTTRRTCRACRKQRSADRWKSVRAAA